MTAAAPSGRETRPTTVEDVLIPVLGCVRDYAWGKKGMSSLVAQIFVRNSLAAAKEESPYAELWMGAHQSAPTILLHDRNTSIADLVERESKQSTFRRQTQAEFPYLFKVLSVGNPLSIQAHPNKQLAKRLHEQSSDRYPDANHKPEMAVALSHFEALCSFRPCQDIAADVARVAEFAAAAGRDPADKFIKDAKNSTKKRDSLQHFFAKLMQQDCETIVKCAKMLAERLEKIEPPAVTEEDKTFMYLHARYPEDVGCFAAYLLNKVKLSPGQAFFIGANEPHAYIHGDCIEIMANSDNVVRAGLTPKYKDVDVLVEMLTYADKPPEIMEGRQVEDFMRVYQPDCSEFQLDRVELPPERTTKLPSIVGPCFLLTVAGEGHVSFTRNEKTTKMPLYLGAIYFYNADIVLEIESDGSRPLVLFRSSPNQQPAAPKFW
eukprot:CAMPEP_0198733096 /NCGR_PEP_ID=MMETSP1475-20131203/42678_1 /TAXON_ID= ORGANISM="Unidentified sp., Strain CCMP1999" /NCGR_SAMPLE_ID=MMETSP1475 /ASSEMBLY_ACC=CAM_ASM_001111 /LENGTH=433 /DNA_ID=CAMNT_0044496339 /DNA_START=16 /DNA_END=1314 /DNA_ORIENTATION=-